MNPRRHNHTLIARVATVLLCVFVIVKTQHVNAQQDDANALPRVLIIGDAMYNQTVREVGNELKGKATVVYASGPSNTVLNSRMALEHLDLLLGRVDGKGERLPEQRWPKWDLIHFNVGLGDLLHVAPNMESLRAMSIHAGGEIATTPQAYEKQLDQLASELKKTGAKVVWASTTPIRASRSNLFRLGSEVEYNAIAERVMQKHAIPTNDMYRYLKSLLNMDKPAGHGFDPFSTDKKPIHEPIVRVIAVQLGIPLEDAELARGSK